MNFNSYWYIGLIFLSLLLLLYTCFKVRSTSVLLLFAAMIGWGYIVETVIYNFLGSYEYYPKLIQYDAFYDSVMGAISSNAFSLPVIATIISAFRLNWIWIILFTGLFVGIEWLFMKLHIYIHHWWRLEYTALGLPGYFALAKVFYRRIIHPLHGFLHTIILYLITGAISGTLHLVTFMFLQNRYYRPGWFADRGHDTVAFFAVYYLCDSLFLVMLAKLSWKRQWPKYVLAAIFFLTVTIILGKLGILQSNVWWDRPYYIALPLLVLLITKSISDRLSAGASVK